MSVKKQKGKILISRRGTLMCLKKSAGCSGRRSKKGREKLVVWLRQHVAEPDVTHGEVRVLGLIGGNKPRRTSQVRCLHDEQHSAVLRILPERLGPVDGSFLDRAVVGVQ